MAQFYNRNESAQSKEYITDITTSGIEQAQEYIYNFFLGIVKYYQADEILDQFNKLFINYEEIKNIQAYDALGESYFIIGKNILSIPFFVVAIFLITIGH